MTLENLLEKIDKRSVSIDQNLIIKSYNLANIAYSGQIRLSGQPATEHALSVAGILIDLGVYDAEALSVAILHGILEETAANDEDIRKEVGYEVLDLVKTVDQLSTIKLIGASEEKYVENLRRMFLSAAKDIRVVLIRLADRLDNMKTLDVLPKEKQIRIATETLEIFAPLAQRLGIGEIKGQLEDLAFPYVYPKEYQQVKKISASSYHQLNKFVLKVKGALVLKLKDEQILAEINGRAKYFYSLYRKLNRPEIGNDISKIYDLMALRVIVTSVEDCYKVLGIVHKIWRPMPGYVRDYIATPKPNGYKSLHTTVIGPGGQFFEIQVRTREMHNEAEYGIAAHWYYAEKKAKSKDKEVQAGFSLDEKLAWVRQLTVWQKELTENDEFLKSLKIDVFADRIFVFTPKGDVKDLPVGATPVDFAYSVHSDLGNYCLGAKANGKMVSLDYKLKSGEVVEVLISKDPNKKPSRDWLSFIVTSHARHQIRKHAKEE